MYEKGVLSLGRVWGWVAFAVAVIWWISYLFGDVAPGTSFPPALEDFLYAALIYNFLKQGKRSTERIADAWISKKFGGVPIVNSNASDSEPSSDDNIQPEGSDMKPKRIGDENG